MSLPPPQGTATCDKRGAPAAGDGSAADHAEPLKWEGVLELLDTIPGVECITAASIIANSAEPIGSSVRVVSSSSRTSHQVGEEQVTYPYREIAPP